MKSENYISIVDKESLGSGADFYDRYVKTGRPVLVKGMLRQWEALRKWDPDYFAEIAGELAMPVKVDIAAGKTRKMPVREYVAELKAYEVQLNRKKVEPGLFPYLHDVPIFHFIPELANDVQPFPLQYFPRWYHENILRYAQFFMSATGSVTPLHFDTLYTNNLFFQVYGAKRFILIPPDQKKYCYRRGWRWTEVSAGQPDFDKYPLFRNATPFSLPVEVGDMLFIPSGTLHEVQTLSPSISFNIDWHTPKTVLKGLLSGFEGAPLKNVYFNALICAGLYMHIPSKFIFPFYKSYLNYIS